MKSFQFKTCFGTVTGHLAEDVCEFESNECIVVGMDGDNDGPYWENNDYDWADLNDMCHRIKDENLYGVADNPGWAHQPDVVIDATDSYLEMNSWKAWVTNDVNRLYSTIVAALKEELKEKVNDYASEALICDEEWSLQDVLEWRDAVYEEMKNNDSEFVDAFDVVAEEKGYEVV